MDVPLSDDILAQLGLETEPSFLDLPDFDFDTSTISTSGHNTVPQATPIFNGFQETQAMPWETNLGQLRDNRPEEEIKE